jgi:hypothetical protein
MNAKSRRGDWFVTYTGRKFWPLDPRVEDIDLFDIAHHLSLTCRFGGAITRFYSVAEHSIYVALIGRPEDCFEAIMHDATEAYLGDMVRPLKYSLPEYMAAEKRLHLVIAKKFGVPEVMSPTVKHCDNVALMTERRHLVIEGAPPFPPELEAIPSSTVPILNLKPIEAELNFLTLASHWNKKR